MGCFLWLGILLLAALVGAVSTGSKIFVVLAAVLTALALYFIYAEFQDRSNLKRFAAWMEENQRFAIVVTSDSPKWANHINDKWLGVFGEHVSVLNYSIRLFTAKSTVCTCNSAIQASGVWAGRELQSNEVPAVWRYSNLFRSCWPSFSAWEWLGYLEAMLTFSDQGIVSSVGFSSGSRCGCFLRLSSFGGLDGDLVCTIVQSWQAKHPG